MLNPTHDDFQQHVSVLAHQQLPQRLAIDEVVVDDIHQPVIILDLIEELLALGCARVHLGPLAPNAKGFLSPGAEAYLLDDGRCHNFLAGEDTPSDCICA